MFEVLKTMTQMTLTLLTDVKKVRGQLQSVQTHLQQYGVKELNSEAVAILDSNLSRFDQVWAPKLVKQSYNLLKQNARESRFVNAIEPLVRYAKV